jgi:hypothetical protein
VVVYNFFYGQGEKGDFLGECQVTLLRVRFMNCESFSFSFF